MEEKLVIKGNKKLTGEVSISGAKNSAVGIIPASILSDTGCVVKNLPEIDDVKLLKEILMQAGAKVETPANGEMKVNCRMVKNHKIDFEMAKKMRASYYFLGAFLGKFKKAEVAFPGGDDIGVRPIDQHIKGFEALGAKIKVEHGIIKARATELVGAPIYLDVVSVGATINIMLAAVKAKGTTVIENAAKEPHIVDIANFLNAMGANIKGAGTDVIKIKGVEYLHECEYSIIPDMIEAGTYMIAAAVTQGNVLVRNVIPTHLESISAKLREMGIEVVEYEDAVSIKANGRPKAVNIKTIPYPGFPTDLQQPVSVLLSIAEGTGIITESIWEGRFKHIDELKRMGAKVKVEGRVAIFDGTAKLSGAPVYATDLRAGAAMVIAGLIADGETTVGGIWHIDRGYENLMDKLGSLGADIRRIQE